MPTIPDIRTSIENQHTLVKDDHARHGTFRRDARGRLISYTGGFTVVFPYETSNGEQWAFRCWHSELGNVRKRFALITEGLRKAALSYFVDFQYEDEGIIVDGKLYPTTRMRWVEGQTIKDYICSHRNPDTLRTLADSFMRMCEMLHEAHIAHGDLQHGNIMVDKSGKLVLVDYDSVFVPEIQGVADSEIVTGLAAYQHPYRRANVRASEKLDYFSELIIYISILAMAENPSLIDKYQIEDSDRMLFDASDYNNLKHSEIYSDISQMNGMLPLLLLILEDYLSKMDINLLEPFNVLLDRYTKEPEIKIFEAVGSNSVYRGDNVALRWNVEHFSTITLDGVPLSAASGTRAITIQNDQEFHLVVSNGMKSCSAVCKVKALNAPKITLKLSKSKLKKGKQDYAQLRWDVKNAGQDIRLYANGEELSHDKRGQESVSPEETTTYTIKVQGLDGKRIFEKSVKLYVHAEGEITFVVDKKYSYPGIPVVLSWDVQNAKTVELAGFGRQSAHDSKTLEPDKDTTYELKVTDAFGCKSRFVEVRMLPLPQIETLLVPTPQINTSVNIQATMPIVQAMVSMPQTSYVQLSPPSVSLKGFEGIDVKMSPTPAFHQLNVNKQNWWTKLIQKLKYKGNTTINIK